MPHSRVRVQLGGRHFLLENRPRLAARFADTAAYQTAVPTYTSGPMTFGWASDDPAVRATPPNVLADISG